MRIWFWAVVAGQNLDGFVPSGRSKSGRIFSRRFRWLMEYLSAPRLWKIWSSRFSVWQSSFYFFANLAEKTSIASSTPMTRIWLLSTVG